MTKDTQPFVFKSGANNLPLDFDPREENNIMSSEDPLEHDFGVNATIPIFSYQGEGITGPKCEERESNVIDLNC